jgi:hypothetical protein
MTEPRRQRLGPPAGSIDVTDRGECIEIIGCDGMLTAQQKEVIRQRCAWHEASHCAAALALGIPLISVTIDGGSYMHRAFYRAATAELGIETMCILCLAGPAGEDFYLGKFDDDAHDGDYQQAHEVLSRQYGPLEIGAALLRFRDAADKLVRSPFGRARIPVIADALLRHGSLTGEAIAALTTAPCQSSL